jgi:hypothetical protein
MRYAPLALLLTGCGAFDLGAIVSLDDLPATLDRTASAVRMVTPSSERPIECVLGRLGADVLEGSATAIRYDAAERFAPGIGLSYGVCLFGMAEPIVLPCKTHRALTLATGYAAELAWAVPAGLRGESATIGGFDLPTCGDAAPQPQPEPAPEPAPEVEPATIIDEATL